jgi:hypothetical protein
MRKIVIAVTGALVLVGWAVAAQEGPKPKPGHDAMGKTGARSDAATIAKATSAAPPEIARNATVMGPGPDGKMKQLRAGTNGWMCMIGPSDEPMCLDKEW